MRRIFCSGGSTLVGRLPTTFQRSKLRRVNQGLRSRVILNFFKWCGSVGSFLFAWGVLSSAALAGPPGVLDDPHAIGAGNIEFIVASAAAEQAGEIGVHGPVLDFTLGIVDGLDFLVVGEAFFVVGAGEEQSESGLLVTGFKWQPLAGSKWNAAWTPVVIVEIDGDKRAALSNAVQVERSFGRFAAGLDFSYTWIDDHTDVWRGGLYGLFGATDRLTLLGEMWFENSALDVTLGLDGADVSATDFAFNLGFDWQMHGDLHMLASAGTGIASDNRERIGWQAYLGFQWVWSESGASPDPPEIASLR